ncbi:MAG: MarR family winged helix-turn-helix transcriptional regulator [Betaproteobacteria bacterium]
MKLSIPPSLPELASTQPAVSPKGCTNFRLHRLMRRLDQVYDAELARAGLKTTQYSLLSHVVRMAPVRPGVLAQAMDLQPSTLTRNLQALVAAGWVEVGAGSDARSRVVTATPAGIDKRKQAQRHWKAAQLRVNALLGEPQVRALHGLLEAALQQLDDGPAQSASGADHG